MKRVLVVRFGETETLDVVGAFDKVAGARKYLRTEAEDGVYAILHTFESCITVGTEKVDVRQVSSGEKVRGAK